VGYLSSLEGYQNQLKPFWCSKKVFLLVVIGLKQNTPKIVFWNELAQLTDYLPLGKTLWIYVFFLQKMKGPWGKYQ